jgi:hypothetical protein
MPTYPLPPGHGPGPLRRKKLTGVPNQFGGTEYTETYKYDPNDLIGFSFKASSGAMTCTHAALFSPPLPVGFFPKGSNLADGYTPLYGNGGHVIIAFEYSTGPTTSVVDTLKLIVT